MKKAATLFVIFCFTALMITGCGKNHTEKFSHIVTGVDISCRQEDVHIHRHYTDSKKMQSVLIYLRLLKTDGKPVKILNQLDADVYEITVHLSDGAKRIYRQKAHRYISQDSQPWQSVDPEQAAQLYQLMRQLPSDSL